MSSSKTCENVECLTEFTPNVKGATSHHCARCVGYARRHDGQLPGPKRVASKGRQISIRVPEDFEERVAKVTSLPPATWARETVSQALNKAETDADAAVRSFLGVGD